MTVSYQIPHSTLQNFQNLVYLKESLLLGSKLRLVFIFQPELLYLEHFPILHWAEKKPCSKY